MAGTSKTKKSQSSSRKNRNHETTELKGKVVLVTGGSRGLGKAIAEALTAGGCEVVITGRDERALAESSAAITRGGGTVFARHCDVRSPESVATLATAIRKQFGRIDILVNNAGIAHALANVDQLPVEAWREVIDTNLTGLFLVTRAALPLMHPGSTIINNLSISAKAVFPGMAAYNASKHGALGFTDTLREELRPRGIRVIALLPGATDTEIWRQFWPEAPREKMMSPQSVADAVVAALRLPGNATVSQIEITPTGGAL
ncbi:MAG TPA: SDR family NAD(P)-dependent oxidoreductase [Terriglobales bacterium]|nr:SDR family NAD(P)-dependent oxidoreductase [Terriglobales bacterium]